MDYTQIVDNYVDNKSYQRVILRVQEKDKDKDKYKVKA